jgi:uncharacterized membrane protein
MQCPVCHSELASPSAAFCNHCGAPLSAAPPVPPSQPAYTPPPAGYPPTPPAYPAQPPASAGLTPNAAAAIAYITVIPAILFLIIEPYNKIPLVRFHSFQSIGLAVVWFALWVVLAILSMFIAIVPGLRLILFMFPLLQMLIGFGFFVLWLVTILKASKGEWFKLPIIGDFAMKQAQS